LDQPETYYDATDILQTAEFAGFDPEHLFAQAVENQRGFKAEGQQMARRLRGPTSTRPSSQDGHHLNEPDEPGRMS
jgi:hypothetical protein